MKRTIAIDFDGVIHKYSRGWQGGEIYDEPVEGAIEAIMSLFGRGYEVVVFTTRDDFDAVRMWIMQHIPDESADSEAPDFEVTNIKPAAIAYIDDRGIRFTNWSDVLKYFM